MRLLSKILLLGVALSGFVSADAINPSDLSKGVRTAKGLRFHYSIKGNEIYFSRKEKSVTRATANIALEKTVELQRKGVVITGPKMLRCFGASYLYPIFIRIGVIQNGDK